MPRVYKLPPRAEMKFWQVLGWAAPPLLALPFIVGITPELVPAWRAALGDGLPGTFKAVHSQCNRDCSYYGPFESTDGTVHLAHARLAESLLELHRNETVEAVDTGSSEQQIFLAHGTRVWVTDSLIYGAAWAGLVVWGHKVRLAFLRRRPKRPRRRR
jgi:hypothetical protein